MHAYSPDIPVGSADCTIDMCVILPKHLIPSLALTCRTPGIGLTFVTYIFCRIGHKCLCLVTFVMLNKNQ